MIRKIVKRDLYRNKIITTALFIFILLSALLVSCGTNIILTLTGAIDNLFMTAEAPHYVQLHTGDFDQTVIDKFTESNGMVKAQQTVKMLVLDGSKIYYGDGEILDPGNIMDVEFIVQNKSFDFILDLDNQAVQVDPGNIAVPIYYMQKHDLEIGDEIRIQDGDFEIVFVISDYARDAIMNPSLLNSKRFVVNEADFTVLKAEMGSEEYMIEFLLHDTKDLNAFAVDYQNSDMPRHGMAVNTGLFKLMSAIADGMVSLIIILVSILLIIIALLCLRLTILTTLEEDYKEIGVMKAIGIPLKSIKFTYYAKYGVLAAAACALGFLLSLPVSTNFTAGIVLYNGETQTGFVKLCIIFSSVLVLLGIVLLFCKLILRKAGKISSVEAMRSGTMGGTGSHTRFFSLHNSRRMGTDLYMGSKALFSKPKSYILLFVILMISSFIMVVPLNISNTIQSPGFVTYLGVGKSDIRIDMQQVGFMDKFQSTVDMIRQDTQISRSAAFVVCRYPVLGSDGTWEYIDVESGDYTVYPLQYLEGSAPAAGDEIALSYLNADRLEVKNGGTVTVKVDGKERRLRVCGIYQDITNGGKTAKARLPLDKENALWAIIYADTARGIDIDRKADEYGTTFSYAKVTPIKDYIAQTLSVITKPLKSVTYAAILIALTISMMVTSLFVKMLIAKEAPQIALMKALGAGSNGIQLQYIVQTIFILILGIVAGTVLAGTLGETAAGLLMSGMGASKIHFIVNPYIAYLLCPLIMAITVIAATKLCSRSINKLNVMDILSE